MNTDKHNELKTLLNLPRIDQIGFVVKDLVQAMDDYGPLFGPWKQIDQEVRDCDFRGETKSCNLRMAFGHTGDLEIELIEMVDGESPHAEFLARGLTGMHHLRYRVENIDEKVALAKQIGYEPIWQKRFNDTMAFCYLEKLGDPLVIEFLEMAEGYPSA